MQHSNKRVKLGNEQKYTSASWREQCTTLLDSIFQMEDSTSFRYPVNLNEYTDYRDSIDCPMDLSTVREKLNNNYYIDPVDFCKDMRLIFQNSRNYNTNKRSRIYSMTIRLSAMFEERIRSIVSDWRSAVKYETKIRNNQYVRKRRRPIPVQETGVNVGASTSRGFPSIIPALPSTSRGESSKITINKVLNSAFNDGPRNSSSTRISNSTVRNEVLQTADEENSEDEESAEDEESSEDERNTEDEDGINKENNVSRTKGVKKLVQNLKQVFLDRQATDTVLKVDNREFKVHRVILIARSPVFASMFQHDLAEKNSNSVDIPDCTAESFEVFLHYLYTGSADTISTNNVHNLYYAADKYHVDDLKEKCVKFMKNNLSVETFCDIIALSLRYGEKKLQKAATNFFCENIKKILTTVQWQKYMAENPTEANELLIKAHGV